VKLLVEGLSDFRVHLNRGAIAEMNIGPFALLPNRGADNVCGVDEVRVVGVNIWDLYKSHERDGKALAPCAKAAPIWPGHRDRSALAVVATL
jgi:hypothetical protein